MARRVGNLVVALAAAAAAKCEVLRSLYQSLAPDDSAKEPYRSPFDSPTI